MATAEIVGMEKSFSADPLRQGKVDRVILYRTERDNVTRFVVTPDEGFTIEAAQAAIRKAEGERIMAQPIRFTY